MRLTSATLAAVIIACCYLVLAIARGLDHLIERTRK